MTSLLNTPKEVVTSYLTSSEKKVTTPIINILVLGILAGAFIAFGASSSSVAMHGIKDVGIARTVAGCVFPVGLMLIIFVGGELFTGDCLLAMGAFDKRYSFIKVIKVLILVYLSNLIGGVLIAFMIAHSNQWNFSDNELAAFTIKIAMGKLSIPFLTAVISGILCNILVCGAVLMAGAAKDIGGKIWAIFFPILAFVISGYEHCVANMYYIPAGIFAAGNSAYREKAMEVYGYTTEQMTQLNWVNMFLKNQLPVTIGNILGGMIFVGLAMWFLHRDKTK